VNRAGTHGIMGCMPFVEANGVRTHYLWDGPEDAPVVVLSNSLGSDLSMWDAQVPLLAKDFRVLRYDTRGHGQSSVPPGPYTIEQLGGDLLGLLDGLGLERVSFCGLSMGGVIGMWLGTHAPLRIYKLLLCNTGAKIGTDDMWSSRIAQLSAAGMPAIVEMTLDRWFTPAFRASHPDEIEAVRRMIQNTPLEGYIANCEALRTADLRDAIASIHNPTLVIVGEHDPATPPELGQFIADEIPFSLYVELDSAHMSAIEAADAFAETARSFLEA
jgi:3-oxoadipate enol-lactonase